MDSVSQLALGAAVGLAVMGRRTARWKAALWGGIAGTLPDLDVLIDFGDAVRNMTYHRSASHALLYLSLASPLLAAIVTRVHGETGLFRRWWLALWLALVTHPLLDAMTVYGTQLALPFTDHPFGMGSIFIIDPLYTLPLLVGIAAALGSRRVDRLHWNAAGLVLSTVYLGWSVLAQQQALAVARESLAAQGVAVQQLMATPTAFNTVLWRIVAVSPEAHWEGFYSLLDEGRQIPFDRFDRGQALYEALRDHEPVQRIAWFSKGYFKMQVRDGQVLMSDLRMGQEPFYVFTFRMAQLRSDPVPLARPEQVGSRPDLAEALPWLWRRAWGEPLRPPR
ncbi:metal-dependent hydrolase [Caldimonas taiwanensis]|uniref:metal-dependent hydrolase n=1 Tax=Caldimonas taiwanensis TaxID=307483 RepID=UPI00078146B1|nr:metal-dependent hydrolase [Caldimonas taiwanensis]